MKELEQYIFSSRGCKLEVTEEAVTCEASSLHNLHCFSWATDISGNFSEKNLVEVKFKNNRKDIFHNYEQLFLKVGDVVAVQSISGHDIGIVNLVGEEVFWQLKKYEVPQEYPKIYRKAKAVDIEKWERALTREPIVLKRSKEIIAELNMKMKLGDVEFQGDGSKAVFYYTADERVDFRELIKILASEFKIRIEMRQIGARQESSKIGGLATCGRELCCVKWKRSFESVTTNAARYQELSLNPSKLAGQCGKLKCCLNYEVDAYIEARNKFPDSSIVLKTKEGNSYFQKSDVFKNVLWYSFDKENSVNITSLSIERVEEIIEMNKKGEIPDTLSQNNLELADLISTKHKVTISQEEIDKSQEKGTFIKSKNKKRYSRRKPNNRNKSNNKQNTIKSSQKNKNKNNEK